MPFFVPDLDLWPLNSS